MLGFKNKNFDDANIKNPPTDDSFPIINTLFENNNEINVNILSLTILDLINKDQIKSEIALDGSYDVGKKLTPEGMEVMKNITLRIANKGELKTSESLALKLLKTMNKNKKFNLKQMAKQSNNSSIANKFEKDFLELIKAFKNENDFDGKNYKDIMENGKFTHNGKEIKKDWSNFRDYLKSNDLTSRYPPESAEENSSQIIYAACFDIEKDALKLRENNTNITEFIDKDGYKLLNIIFNNALSNVTEKRKGDGIFDGINDKYTIPGGG